MDESWTHRNVFLSGQFDDFGCGGVEGPTVDGRLWQSIGLTADAQRFVFGDTVHGLLAATARRPICSICK